MAGRWRKIAVFVFVWGAANLIAVYAIEWHERVTLETKYKLRPGILSEFEIRYLEVRSADNQTIEIPYRVFEPEMLSGVRYPIFLYLHGAGERGDDTGKQVRSLPSVLTDARRRQSYPCFIVAPQCPKKLDWSAYRDQFRRIDRHSGDIILQMIDDVARHPNADIRRVYVAGFSMGSFGTWDIVADYPDRFAAAVPISGGVTTDRAYRLAHVPIWTVHGDRDQACPVEHTRNLVQAIKDSGGSPRYTELKGVGHGAWRPMLEKSDELLYWMFAQRKKTGWKQ